MQLLKSLLGLLWTLCCVAGLGWAAVAQLRGAWLGWRLRRQGVRVGGVLTGKRLAGSLTYQVRFAGGLKHKARFQTLAGQPVEAESQGLVWGDPAHYVTDEVGVYYDEAQPTRFLLESELGKGSLRMRLAVGVFLALWAGLAAWDLWEG